MGGSSSPSSQTVVQTDLPIYAADYVQRAFARAERESKRSYQPYGGQRLADVMPATQQQYNRTWALPENITGMPAAQDATNTAMHGARGIASLGSPFQAANFTNAGKYTANNVGEYMSPYMQNVVDVQKARAQLDFDRAQAGRDAQAVQAGAFGGSRGAVVDALAQEDLARRMDEIQAQGQQAAFEQGARMFSDDRDARMQTEAMRAAEQGRVQQGEMSLRELGLGAYGMSGAMADQLAQLGGAERQAYLEKTGLLGDIGREQQARSQQFRDLAYQDFLRQQDYPKEQLQFLGDFLRGNVRGSTQSSMQFEQANPYKDLLGAGISAAALSQLFGS